MFLHGVVANAKNILKIIIAKANIIYNKYNLCVIILHFNEKCVNFVGYSIHESFIVSLLRRALK